MSDPKFTRCPGCSTVFRVTPAQLALRDGQVRCGHCRAVFDANDHVVSLDAGPAADEFDAQDELMRGRATVTLRSADALQPVPAAPVTADERTADERTADTSSADRVRIALPGAETTEAKAADELAGGKEVSGEEAPEAKAPGEGAAGEGAAGKGAAGEKAAGEGAAGEGAAGEGAAAEGAAGEKAAGERAPGEGAAGEGTSGEGVSGRRAAAERGPAPVEQPVGATAGLPPIDVAASDRFARFEWKRPRPAGRAKAIHAGAIGLLVVALLLQAVLGYRNALAAHLPATRPLLAAACRVLSCAIEAVRDAAALSIDASDLQADPAHRGLLLLTATIRNRAAHAIAYPYLELTLTDPSDRTVVRRAFAPAEYARGAAEPRQGIPANGEHVVRLFLDASATQQAGYRLYLFYP